MAFNSAHITMMLQIIRMIFSLLNNGIIVKTETLYLLNKGCVNITVFEPLFYTGLGNTRLWKGIIEIVQQCQFLMFPD